MRERIRRITIGLAISLPTLVGCGNDPAPPPSQVESQQRQSPHPTTAPVGRSPFLASHEQQAKAPSKGDVDPSFHVSVEQLKSQVQDEPRNAEAVLQLARLLQDSHQLDSAATAYERYLSMNPLSREAWLDLAQVYGSLGEWPKALSACDSLLARYPDDPSGLYNKGAVFANLGIMHEATDLWEHVKNQTADPQMAKMAELALRRVQ